jgi:hypothetical protein
MMHLDIWNGHSRSGCPFDLPSKGTSLDEIHRNDDVGAGKGIAAVASHWGRKR